MNYGIKKDITEQNLDRLSNFKALQNVQLKSKFI